MEVFVDFGLFELLAAAGLAIVSRKIYSRRWLGLGCLSLSLVAPLALVFVTHEGWGRWLAVVCLVTALVNASLIFSLMQRGRLLAMLIEQSTPATK